MNAAPKILIVGRLAPEQLGAHFADAARELGMEVLTLDVKEAWSQSIWINRFARRLMHRRPVRLNSFGLRVVEMCGEHRPALMLVSGIAAPAASALRQARKLGVRCVNFLTDDPWNRAMTAPFFWNALREYDAVYTPRRQNEEDLRRHGCRRVEYLPFAYNPAFHFPEAPVSAADRERFETDAVIVGGADRDRAPIAQALVRSGLRIALYGSYWDRWPELRPFHRGFAVGSACRMAVCGARVNIGMVRRSNRDGHAMRSLELPAMHACIVVEDTPEHRELFGPNGECVEYYGDPGEMARKSVALCREPARACELGQKVYRKICVENQNTYADRLKQILKTAL